MWHPAKDWILYFPLCCWILLASCFILRTPVSAYTHDFRANVVYTQIIATQHRFPSPREHDATYHPPLYYLICSLLAPQSSHHALFVRILSMSCGFLALVLLRGVLNQLNTPASISAGVLLFVATTPAYVFLFTSYNNDSLATLLALAACTCSFRLSQRWNWRLALGLLVLCTAGLYTKLTILLAMAAWGGTSLLVALRARPYLKNCVRLVGVYAVACFLLVPWLYLHNYRSTGQWLPARSDSPFPEQIQLPDSPLKTLLTPPGWAAGEWKDPYVHLWETANNKKHSYLAYVFATSIWGEYTFEFMPSPLQWLILGLHAVLLIASFLAAKELQTSQIAVTSIVLGVLSLSGYFIRAPYAADMDFRFIAWLWLPATVLLAGCYRRLESSKSATFFWAGLVGGTLAQGLLLLTIIWGSGRWFFA